MQVKWMCEWNSSVMSMCICENKLHGPFQKKKKKKNINQIGDTW